LAPENGVLLKEEMLLGSFVEAAAAPTGMGESFVEAADAPTGMGESFVETA